MKTALALLLSFAAAAFAQEMKKDKTPAPQEQKQLEKRRLQSVTWDVKNHKLVWVVEKGSDVDGKFVQSSSDRYEIAPETAQMAYADEKRGFTEDEAVSLQHLLDVLSLYCAESTMWWDQGEGVPLDKDGVPTGPAKKPTDTKPRRVQEQPKARPLDAGIAALAAR